MTVPVEGSLNHTVKARGESYTHLTSHENEFGENNSPGVRKLKHCSRTWQICFLHCPVGVFWFT